MFQCFLGTYSLASFIKPSWAQRLLYLLRFCAEISSHFLMLPINYKGNSLIKLYLLRTEDNVTVRDKGS